MRRSSKPRVRRPSDRPGGCRTGSCRRGLENREEVEKEYEAAKRSRQDDQREQTGEPLFDGRQHERSVPMSHGRVALLTRTESNLGRYRSKSATS